MLKGYNNKIPMFDPVNDTVLYRCLRYNLNNGSRRKRGTDLFARKDADNTIVYYFRHWDNSSTGPATCQVTSKEEAVRFSREQFTRPGFCTGGNHRGLSEFLPEVYSKA
ncbi:hypothetical protein [uncultured Methanoregula sp.]|uniref:hypothetical protein n=1 Tax=uncultured Methanoregula sp. TaxID=1005933 RepID=UPI002AAAAD7F|nr:hypothetical protein [uncultured Methanoregula sp.]